MRGRAHRESACATLQSPTRQTDPDAQDRHTLLGKAASLLQSPGAVFHPPQAAAQSESKSWLLLSPIWRARFRKNTPYPAKLLSPIHTRTVTAQNDASAKGEAARSTSSGQALGTAARRYSAPGSLRNPFVHSLPVTLGNHAVHDAQTYNWPC